LIEQLKTRGAPFAVSCALHVSLVAGLVLTHHWVSSAVALHPPVLPVQLVTLEAPAPVPAPEAPAPSAASLKPPRLLAPPKPSPKPNETPVVRAEERPLLTSPAPIAPAPPTLAREAPAEPVAAPPATTILSSPLSPSGELSSPSRSSSPGDAAPPSRHDVPAAPPAAGLRTAAVAPDGITQYARPQGGYQVRPSYPAAPRRLGVQGTTLLRVHVLADGRIGDVLVEKSAGHPDLDDAATDAVKRWRFDPARRGREAVAMWVLLPVEFKLR
jgi:protein TonB